jgi:hypothetical protein
MALRVLRKLEYLMTRDRFFYFFFQEEEKVIYDSYAHNFFVQGFPVVLHDLHFISIYTCFPHTSAMLKPAFSKIGIQYLKIRQHSDFCANEGSNFILYECNFFYDWTKCEYGSLYHKVGRKEIK